MYRAKRKAKSVYKKPRESGDGNLGCQLPWSFFLLSCIFIGIYISEKCADHHHSVLITFYVTLHLLYSSVNSLTKFTDLLYVTNLITLELDFNINCHQE